MTRIDFLLAELTHETATARRHLERLPPDQLAWRPHPKSSTAGRLASHLVDCIRWVEPIWSAALAMACFAVASAAATKCQGLLGTGSSASRCRP
jgi:hypothetical protein